MSCSQYKPPLEPEMQESEDEEEEEEDQEKDKKTAFHDRFNRDYARMLSQTSEDLEVTYHTFSECELFHRAGGTWSKTDQQMYPNIRTLLKKVHPHDSCLGIRTKTMSLKSILTKLMRSDEEMQRKKLDFSGFVCLHGGHESAQDNAGSKTRLGWCLQRCKPPLHELGPFTAYQHSLAGKDEIDLEKRCEKPQTMTKTSFHDEGELIGAPYLRWLVQDRGLTHYQCSHFLMFRKKNYLTGFISGMLQKRHEMKKTGTNSLAAECYKLLLNR